MLRIRWISWKQERIGYESEDIKDNLRVAPIEDKLRENCLS